MRDFLGAHVSQVDKYGYAVDIDGVHASTSVIGSFHIKYAGHIDKVCVGVQDNVAGYSGLSMQLTAAQAIRLRELLDAAISDALAATVVEVQPELVGGGEPE